MGSLLLYIFAFICSALLANVYQNKYKGKVCATSSQVLWSIMIMSVPIILGSMRFGIGVDYDNYTMLFEKFHYSSWAGFHSDTLSYEYGNKAIVDLGFFLSGNTRGVFALYSFITLTLFEISILHYKDRISVPVTTFVLLLMLYPFSLNVVRQSLSIAIVFFSIRFIEERKLKEFLVCCVLATLIHSTAVLSFAFYFLYSDGKDNKPIKTILRYVIIIVPLFLAFLSTYVSEVALFARYFENYETESTDITVSYILKLPVLLPLLIEYRNYKHDGFVKLLYMLFVMELGLLFSAASFKWGFRLSYYSYIGQILIIGILSSESSRSQLYKKYFPAWFMLTFYVLYFIWGRDGIFPYTHF